MFAMPQRLSLLARLVLPISLPPLPGGFVSIQGETIVHVGRQPAFGPIIDLGDVVILPSLVNAHTHLEFSALPEPIPPGQGFTDWLRKVIDYRRSMREGALAAAAATGLSDSKSFGITALGEIATANWSEEPFLDAELDTTVFQEFLGLSPNRAGTLVRAAQEHANRLNRPHLRYRVGLSPHAPYSIHPDVISHVAQMATNRIPLAMHLAESRDEIELLQNQSGPLRTLLDSLEAWSDGVIPQGQRPLHYLRLLAAAARALIIHGNYLDTEEINFISQCRGRMSVVYCPRTHSHFRHETYPLAKMLAAGVRMVIATDSRASNPDLNLLEDMNHAARMHADVSPRELFRMVTCHAAEALGLGDSFGSIQANRPANLIVLSPWNRDSEEPYADIIADKCRVVALIQNGRICWDTSGRLDTQGSKN